MNKRRSFVGLTSLVVVILILFMLVFSSLAYLSSDSYHKSAERRLETRQKQYRAENSMYELVFEISEVYDGDNLEEIVSTYELDAEKGVYVGEIVIGDYKTVFYLEMDQEVRLKSYYLENVDEQEYGEQKFDF